MTHVKLSRGELGLLGEAVQVLPGKLYFRRAVLPPCETPAMHFFSTDREFVYEPFFLDFGPLNLSCIFRYCMLVKSKLGWFDLASFDQATYDHYERLENGDLTWIIPGKFLAFSCPAAGSAAMSSRRRSGKDDGTPLYYVNVFKKLKDELMKMDAIPNCSPVRRTESRSGADGDTADALANSFKHMGLADKEIAEHGDEGQGDRLVEAKWRAKPVSNVKRDSSQLQTSSSFSDSSSTAGKTPQLRRSSTSAISDEPSAASRLEAVLKSKYVGHLLTPLAAVAASAGRQPTGGSCHVSSAGSPSGVYMASASGPSTNRSRNDV
ncbi:hypothetical protein Emag_004960 [Eimeria magna]